MINAIFIISASGGCVFYHEYKKLGGGLDHDLVSGFLIALQNFARETFGEAQEPQKLDLAGDLRLVYSLNKETHLLGACVADAVDHPKLVQKLIDKILMEFVKLFKHKLDKSYEISQFSEFEVYVDRLIKSKITKRGPPSFFLGILLTTLLIPAYLIPLLYLMIKIDPNFIDNQLLLTTFLFVLGGLPQILAGYIAGNKKLGFISAIIISVIIIPGVILFLFVNLFISSGYNIGAQGTLLYLTFMPLILPENIALAWFGGYRREIKHLNPLQKD
ncbi:MAG: hypothetical protein HWN66_06010 [Candidatus Helarchaeota archaeon]|nr:hypothetical protein [Candidatus Helarchaeota archaeon]